MAARHRGATPVARIRPEYPDGARQRSGRRRAARRCSRALRGAKSRDSISARRCGVCAAAAAGLRNTDLGKLAAIRSVRDFDEAYTAPYFGFDGAEDYYYRASSMRVVDRIGLPALVITAKDDPFVPPEPFLQPQVAGNPHITLLLSEHGGRCGFVGPADGDEDGYWAERQVVRFFDQAAHREPDGPRERTEGRDDP